MTAIEYETDQKHFGIPGALTLAVLGVLWRAERPLNLTAVHRAVCAHYKPVSLTTVSSTLARLYDKGWTSRPRAGVHQAAITRQQLVAHVSDKLSSLIDDMVLAIEEV